MENGVTALLRIWRQMVFGGIKAEDILEIESIQKTGRFQ